MPASNGSISANCRMKIAICGCRCSINDTGDIFRQPSVIPCHEAVVARGCPERRRCSSPVRRHSGTPRRRIASLSAPYLLDRLSRSGRGMPGCRRRSTSCAVWLTFDHAKCPAPSNNVVLRRRRQIVCAHGFVERWRDSEVPAIRVDTAPKSIVGATRR